MTVLEQTLNVQKPISFQQNASSLKAWLVCLTAALFFFYQFVQLNIFGVIHDDLIQVFQLSASQYGLLSAVYLIANVFFLIPAGFLLDRYSTRKIILVSMALCVTGTYLFSLSAALKTVIIARFLMGIGSAFCFVACVRLASRWFPQEKMAFVTGSIVTVAMLGGFVAQAPMGFLVRDLGWRGALFWDTIVGLIIIAAISLFVRDYPANYQKHSLCNTIVSKKEILKTYTCLQNWLAALYTACLNVPLAVFGAVWGIPYLMYVHGFSLPVASFINSLLFCGFIVGSPLIGWLSDTLKKRQQLMILGAVVTLFISLLLVLPFSHNAILYMFVFFLLGFFTSTQVISYTLLAENNPSNVTATAVSIISFSTQSLAAISQPLYGFLLQRYGTIHYAEGVTTYLSHAYQLAAWLLPCCVLIALLLVLNVKDHQALNLSID